MPVRVVTDSTSDLMVPIRTQRNITVVPLKVHWGDTTYIDGVDLQADEFFERLSKTSALPKTSQPTPAEFEQAYRQLDAPEGVVSIHISRKLSGTINSAELAVRELSGQISTPIEIVDSQIASFPLGMIVLTAQDVADKGGSLADVKAAAESAARRTKVAFVVDTLEYLEKGGRIGKASAFLGNLLSVKPILTVVDGEVHPMERVRTRTKAIDRLAEYILSFPNPERYAVAHSTTPGDAADLAQRLRSKLPDQEVTISRFGPVLGVYLGPGAIGAAVMQAE